MMNGRDPSMLKLLTAWALHVLDMSSNVSVHSDRRLMEELLQDGNSDKVMHAAYENKLTNK